MGRILASGPSDLASYLVERRGQVARRDSSAAVHPQPPVIKHARQKIRRYTGAGVCDFDACQFLLRVSAHGNRSARFGVFDGIGQQIAHALSESRKVTQNMQGLMAHNSCGELGVLLAEQWLDSLDRLRCSYIA
jgi:hypothetical protein